MVMLSSDSLLLRLVVAVSLPGHEAAPPRKELHKWDVKAQCAALYHGTAVVKECDDDGLPYGISAQQKS